MKHSKNLLKVIILSSATLLTVGVAMYANSAHLELDAYDTSNLPTRIDLNDCSEEEIREYYSDLNSLVTSERKGTNLLKNLKPILANGQKYYAYDSGDSIWRMYEITDRDWAKSPASSTTYGTYNSETNIITGYQYGSSASNSKNNPYIHALYINRDIDNQTTAWDDHNQDAWGINREHIWAKSHGFEEDGEDSAGGARGDPMHLWAGNGWANHEHSNNFFAFVDRDRDYSDAGTKYNTVPNNLTGYSKNAGGNEKVFEPQDCDKGDIARAIFYMVARYNNYANETEGFDGNNPNLVLLNDLSENSRTGLSTYNDPYGMGLLSDLLAWNELDPVDEYERHRNNLLYKNYTNNRNPFIDFPHWANAIWGTVDLDGTNYNSEVTSFARPASDPIGSSGSIISYGSLSSPLSVSEATEVINSDSGDTQEKMYVTGTVSLSSYNTNNNYYNYVWLQSEDGQEDQAFELYHAKLDENIQIDFTATNALQTYDIVAYGYGKKYNNTTYELAPRDNDYPTIVSIKPSAAQRAAQESIEGLTTTTTLAYHYDSETTDNRVDDTLTNATTEITGTRYSDWTSSDFSSGITYTGNSAGGNSSIQLRNSDNAGIVTTANTNNKCVSNITVTWNSNTASGRTLDIYGKNTAYSSPSDLYNADSQGTKLGSIVYGTSTSLTITGDYQYIGIKSKSGAQYIDSIVITWGRLVTTYEYSNVSIRFGGLLSQDLWNTLDGSNPAIEGFGVMITSENYMNENETIKDTEKNIVLAESNPDIDSNIVNHFMSKEDMATPVVNGDNYFWNLFFRISVDDLDKEFIAAAYIKTKTDIVFMNQVRYSTKTLAADYITNRGCNSETAAGSLSNLANL